MKNHFLTGYKASLITHSKKLIIHLGEAALTPIFWAWGIHPENEEVPHYKKKVVSSHVILATYISSLLYVLVWWPITEFPIIGWLAATLLGILLLWVRPETSPVLINLVNSLWLPAFPLVVYLITFF